MSRTTDTPRYSTMSLTECEAFYHDEIKPEMRADGLDPRTETPPYAWLKDRYAGFVGHLSRKLDLSPGEFYEEIGVPPKDPPTEEPFGFVEDDATQEALDNYLEELATRQGRAEATVNTRRSVLRKYVRVYQNVHGEDDLLTGICEGSRAEEKDRVADTFDVLRRQEDALNTHASKLKYVQEVRQFYQHQVDFGAADFDPTYRLEKRMGWDSEPEWDNPALEADQVRVLHAAAETDEDRLLVIAVCGWGLRPSEAAALRVGQLVLGAGDEEGGPHIEFEEGERKNGPGSVSLLTGLDAVDERLDDLANRDGWNGFLFPSSRSRSGHISTSTIRRRFQSLAEEADVTVDGERPTPKLGRRFWYTTYGDAVRRVAERFADVAEEQGSTDEGVVLDNYLSEAEQRRHRRQEMRDELEGLFN
ncbi:tyrosine-type recombinase/integrase [Haloarcula sp. CBA1127]|uniref:tyrosine-type recombinase/integrase n=1 Tax=Haloarcula sp. CBA1127 TaxID=1765055 RepID=UPI00073F726F|nr:tyrosine-type recombinase/integrase [Haloarcula sp. CBA1127]